MQALPPAVLAVEAGAGVCARVHPTILKVDLPLVSYYGILCSVCRHGDSVVPLWCCSHLGLVFKHENLMRLKRLG